jgi:hypothetical protein
MLLPVGCKTCHYPQICLMGPFLYKGKRLSKMGTV